jgi:hypothetical protein
MLFTSNNRLRLARRLFWLLLPAILLAQWVGLAHRIAHAGGSEMGTHKSVVISQVTSKIFLASLPFGEDSRLHSCIALDAATASDYLHSPILAVAANDATEILTLLSQHQLWLAQPERYFSSRAPPTLYV